ncbi:MAG: hydroxymethylbilane synthase [Myxococcaceae bacterium]|nr:hydroxymethylbilane synthase [Myxococcaceae bacterium]
MTTLTGGTRGSDLALWQTRHVSKALKEAIAAAGKGVAEVKEQIITTRGDVDMTERLVGKLEKGFFTAELEDALREKRIDFAVHSLKDLPTRMPPGLDVAAVLPRAAVNDLLLVRPQSFAPGEAFPVKPGGTVGASSLRRDALLKRFAPKVKPVPLRGNVPTRVQRLREGKCDAILLAAAGLNRLGLDLSDLKVFKLDHRRWPTAPGQGAIGVQTREGQDPARALCALLDHQPTRDATAWERAFLRVLEGGCATPFGATVEDGVAYLGQALPEGFRLKAVKLPPAKDDVAREAFVRDVLPRLFDQDQDHADRPLLHAV